MVHLDAEIVTLLVPLEFTLRMIWFIRGREGRREGEGGGRGKERERERIIRERLTSDTKWRLFVPTSSRDGIRVINILEGISLISGTQ